MPRRLFVLSLLCALVFAQDDDGAAELARARARVRDLETDIQKLIDAVSPAVGAVSNYAAQYDAATGKVSMRMRSLGSGVLVDARGFLLTNVHVVAGAGHLTVTLPDGVRYPAVLFADTSEGAVKGDIALVKLRGKKRFPFVSWRDGNAAKLKPGAFVFAMGNPHGHALDGTPVVTMGIVSGQGRAAAETGYLYIDSLQTDAEINPGNSGGPLFDAKGRFVGINGLMNSRQGRSNSGVGFAIPVNQIRLFMRKLLKDEGGGVGYGFHGLTRVETATNVRGGGARVKAVVARSPADAAGIEKDDVITKVLGKRVKNRTEFINLIGKQPEGKIVAVTYKRGRSTKVAKFRLANYNAFLKETGRERKRTGPLPVGQRGYLGVEWKKAADGVEVTIVHPAGGAAKAGVRVGDVITVVDGIEVKNGAGLSALLAVHEPDERLKIKVRRRTSSRSMKITLCDAATQAGLLE